LFVATLLEARTKLKIAENTSDLSTSEERYNVKTTKSILKISDPPLYSPKISTEGKYYHYILISYYSN